MEIANISLLTLIEAFQLPDEMRHYKDYWWLQCPGYLPDCVAVVDKDGFVLDCGIDINEGKVAIRPVLTVSDIGSSELNVGDRIIIQKKSYVYIGNNRLLYNDEPIYHRFDLESDDYEKSEIKQIVDNWL